MKIIDISWPLERGMAIYPGNPPFRVKPYKYKSSVMAEVSMGNHTGTHVDAPRHALKKGKTIERAGIEAMVGPCRVLDMTHVKKAISASDLQAARIRKGERILVKTKNSKRGFKKFYNNYIYLDGDAAEFLAQKQIGLFGTDYISIKQKGSSDNRAHTELLKRGIVIFEGLNLSRVKPGVYYFIGLPLNFKGLDGAPARAILLEPVYNLTAKRANAPKLTG